MKLQFTIIITMLLIGCKSNSDIQKHHSLAEEYRSDNNFGKAIVELRTIVNNYPNYSEAAQSQFQIAEIYLNDVKDYDFAIEEFQQLITLYPNEKIPPKALFMIGYTYANYLDAYSHALRSYRNFISQYPNHELIPSVEYEIDGLMQYETIIDSLNKIALKPKKENI